MTEHLQKTKVFFFFYFLIISYKTTAQLDTLLPSKIIRVKPGESIEKKLFKLKNRPGVIALDHGVYEISHTLMLSSGQSIIGQGNSTIIIWKEFRDSTMIMVKGRDGEVIGSINDNNADLGSNIPIMQIQSVEGKGNIKHPIEASSLKKYYKGYVRVYDNLSSELPKHEINELTDFNATQSNTLSKRLVQQYNKKVIVTSFYPQFNIEIKSLRLVMTNLQSKALLNYDNIFQNVSNYGIRIDKGHFVHIKDVTFEGFETAINITDSYNVDIKNCFFKKITRGSIHIIRSVFGEVSGNNIVNSFMTGIYLSKGIYNYTLRNNKIYGTSYAGCGGGDGITLQGVENVSITHNEVYASSCYGIWALSEVRNVSITDNIIQAGITSGIYFNGLESEQNTVTNAIISRNIIIGNEAHPIFLNPGINVIVKDNILQSNLPYPIPYVADLKRKSQNNIMKDNILLRDVSQAEMVKSIDDRKNNIVSWLMPEGFDSLGTKFTWEQLLKMNSLNLPIPLTQIDIVDLGPNQKGLCVKKVSENDFKFLIKSKSNAKNVINLLEHVSYPDIKINGKLKLTCLHRVISRKIGNISLNAMLTLADSLGRVTFDINFDTPQICRLEIWANSVKIIEFPIDTPGKDVSVRDTFTVNRDAKTYEVYIINRNRADLILNINNWTALQGEYPEEIQFEE